MAGQRRINNFKMESDSDQSSGSFAAPEDFAERFDAHSEDDFAIPHDEPKTRQPE